MRRLTKLFWRWKIQGKKVGFRWKTPKSAVQNLLNDDKFSVLILVFPSEKDRMNLLESKIQVNSNRYHLKHVSSLSFTDFLETLNAFIRTWSYLIEQFWNPNDFIWKRSFFFIEFTIFNEFTPFFLHHLPSIPTHSTADSTTVGVFQYSEVRFHGEFKTRCTRN